MGSRRALGVRATFEATRPAFGGVPGQARGAAGRGANGLPGPVTSNPRERANRASNAVGEPPHGEGGRGARAAWPTAPAKTASPR